jgi:hypothetical protein
MGRLSVIAALLCLLVAKASAEDGPRFGGCFSGGALCVGPSAAITVGELNLSTGKFSGGVIPGVGYGIVYQPSKWYATGLAAYLSFLVGRGQANQVAPTLMVSFASYIRLGLGAIVQEQEAGPARTQWRLMFGMGSDF